MTPCALLFESYGEPLRSCDLWWHGMSCIRVSPPSNPDIRSAPLLIIILREYTVRLYDTAPWSENVLRLHLCLPKKKSHIILTPPLKITPLFPAPSPTEALNYVLTSEWRITVIVTLIIITEKIGALYEALYYSL